MRQPRGSRQAPGDRAPAKEALRYDEFEALLAKAEGGRLCTFILRILATGLRRGELLARRWRHVDLEAGVVFVVESVAETRAFTLKWLNWIRI